MVRLVEQGKLTVDTRNKENVDIFLLAVDCEFSFKTLKFLIDHGFKVNTQDN